MSRVIAGVPAKVVGSGTQVSRVNSNSEHQSSAERNSRTMTDNEYPMEKVDFAALVVGDRHEGPTVGVFSGEGTGPAVIDATLHMARATGTTINWRRLPLTADDCRKNAGKIPAEILDELTRCDSVLMGPLPSLASLDGSDLSVAQLVRRSLGLLVHKTEILPLPGLDPAPGSGHRGLRVFRERPESLYYCLGEEAGPIFEQNDIFSNTASRIADVASAEGARLGFRSLTVIPDLTHPNWCDIGSLSAVRKIVEANGTMEYSEIEPKIFVERAVSELEQFEIVLTSHSFGEIACHLSAAILGGAHLVPSVTYGIGATLFEAFADCGEIASSMKHVNPTAMVRAAILMLDHIGEGAASERLRAALHAVYRNPRNLTPDVGGHRTTIGFANAVIGAIEDPRGAEELSCSLSSAVSFS